MSNQNKNLPKNNKTSYNELTVGIVNLLETARRQAARSINVILTATYWEIGRRIVEFEQLGSQKAEYGKKILKQLSAELTAKFGRGFGWRNLYQMRNFYLSYRNILQTASAKSKKLTKLENLQTVSANFHEPTISRLQALSTCFLLSWSHYVRLLSVENENARSFYEAEALRGSWSVRQLDRQISSQFYERTLLSKNKEGMLEKATIPLPTDVHTPEDEIKDPYVLEFLGLKDEYSEKDLEEALVHHLETFLLELGGDFAFIARQKRMRVGSEWYRVDLVFYHRRLRSLILIDLKIGKFTHADAGQMHLYLNYAREHWTHEKENPPVGLILCAEKDHTVAKYALDGLPNKVIASEYKLALPDEKELAYELTKTRKMLEARQRRQREDASK